MHQTSSFMKLDRNTTIVCSTFVWYIYSWMHHSNIATLAAIVHSLKQHYINRGNGIYSPDLGRFRLRSRNQTTTPILESESESFVVHFGGVGIVVVGIGVGIVVIGIGIRWRFHTFMYTYHLTFIQEVTPRKLKALSHRVRNTARWKWLCLFRVDCCAVCISMYSIQACQLILFNNGPQQLLDFYFCSVHSKETVGLIGQIWANWVNPVLWCYNAAK